MSSARLLRVLRAIGIALLAFAIPSAVITWSQEGLVTALVVLAAHLYIGTFAAWGLPWLLRRVAT